MHFERMLGVLLRNKIETEVSFTRSRRGGWHAYVRVPGRSFTAVERIAWQAVLGSDRVREFLSLMRLERAPDVPPTVLFEPIKPRKTVRGIALGAADWVRKGGV